MADKEKETQANISDAAPVKAAPVDMDALRKQVRQELKAEEAAESANRAKNVRKTSEQALKAAGKDLVTVELFKDNDKYKGDVTVSVNGKNWIIQRGVRVKVPRCVAEVLESSLGQDKAVANMVGELKSDYEAAVSKNAL